MARRVVLGIVASAFLFAGLAASAYAAPTRLYLSEGAAFAVLGHWCGGIQQQVYVRGFGSNGYPVGTVSMLTRCGGSGRGGGYKVTTYTGTANVEWTWFGETRSYSSPASAPLEALGAEDAYGDKVYNEGAAAYLLTGSPPYQPPGAPTNVTAGVGLYEPSAGVEYLRMTVGWTVAPETAGLLKYSTITAVPLNNAKAQTLTAQVTPYFSSGSVSPVEPNTTYRVTVTSTDAEGTSAESTPIEITTPNSDGEAAKEKQTYASCLVRNGKIKLTPGLTETPAVQTITATGEFFECSGPNVPETGKFTDHLKTTEELTCSALSSASTEPGTVSTTGLTVKWLPLEEGTSKGTLLLPLSEVSFAGVSGALKGGPFEASTPIKAATIAESFTGASLCGVPQGKLQVVKPVKAGVFSTSEVEFR